jgi:hypothetical protein
MASDEPKIAPELIAYVLNPALSVKLVTAPGTRAWMEASNARFANRCLPLLIANQSGWLLLSDHSFRVTWSGATALEALTIEYLSGPQPYPAASHFGHGILTFSLPFLFRTSPGYNLLVRGPANLPKDGAAALEGVVETDWCPATFTVNWQLTRKHQPVLFEQGEPIAMLVPQRRGELESFRPALRTLQADHAVLSEYQEWSRARAQFLADLRVPGSQAVQQKWQKDYFQGVSARGASISEHQTKLALREFSPLSDTPAEGQPSSAPAQAAAHASEQPSAEQLLAKVIVVEQFLAPDACERLISVHRRFASLTTTSDNGFDLTLIQTQARPDFEFAASIIERIKSLIAEYPEPNLACERATLCAFTAGGLRSELHAGSVMIACPRHGSDAEHLVRVSCACEDVQVVANHSPWRLYSAQIWLNDDCQGGETVLGAGPHSYGRAYRKQLEPRCGSLLLTPSNEHYFRHSNSVTQGTSYLLQCWFTADAAHAGPAWRSVSGTLELPTERSE